MHDDELKVTFNVTKEGRKVLVEIDSDEQITVDQLSRCFDVIIDGIVNAEEEGKDDFGRH